MSIKMNGLRSELARNQKTVFVALPMECWRPIQGGCGCPYCKAHPELIPHWDTLVVNPTCGTGKVKSPYSDFTSTCHYPELANPTGQHWTLAK